MSQLFRFALANLDAWNCSDSEDLAKRLEAQRSAIADNPRLDERNRAKLDEITDTAR